MKAKDVIKGIEEGFDDNEQIADAVEWVEDAANRLAEFEQDNHMQDIEIEKLKAENERLKASHARYETLRKLNVVQFQHLYTKALQSPIPFDELVDMLGEAK